MSVTAKNAMDFIEESDVKSVLLAFCDPSGTQKNISVMPSGLASAFENGVLFDASAIRGFSDTVHSDLLLFPDPNTLKVLPRSPQQRQVARFFCDIRRPGGVPFPVDSRTLLKRVLEHCRTMGFECQIGAECEFYLFKTEEDGEPTEITIDNGNYLDIPPLDKGDNIRREICLSLEDMGIHSKASYHQQGPGQNAIELEPTDAMNCADNILSTKFVIKTISANNGMFGSFMPKPIPTKSGSGLHLKIALNKNGQNIFNSDVDGHSALADSFVAGVLSRIREMTLFLNPIANSYERFGTPGSPKYVSWSQQDRTHLIRLPSISGDKACMELRSPDPSLNPYLAFALLISSGLDGIEGSLSLPPAADTAAATSKPERLPMDICEAVELAAQSKFLRDIIGAEAFARLLTIKTEEASAFRKSQDKREFFREKYFKII